MELDLRPAWCNYWASLGFAGLFLIIFIGSPATDEGTHWLSFWIAAVLFGLMALRRYAARYTVAGDKIVGQNCEGTDVDCEHPGQQRKPVLDGLFAG